MSTPPDDISDYCIVYRVVKKRDIKPDGRPQSDCFSDKAAEDGSGYYMSVYFSDQMGESGKSVVDLQRKWGPEYTVVAFRPARLRQLGERLWRDPDDDFPGHGACKRADYGERTRGQKRNLAKAAEIPPELREQNT